MVICLSSSALDSLGFGAYKEDATEVLKEAKAVAAKKRRGSSRLENLGIPEEELLRQQQELFAQVEILIHVVIGMFFFQSLFLSYIDKQQ